MAEDECPLMAHRVGYCGAAIRPKFGLDRKQTQRISTGVLSGRWTGSWYEPDTQSV